MSDFGTPDNVLYYLRSIKRMMNEILPQIPGPTLASEIVADNRDWLDCYVDLLERRTRTDSPGWVIGVEGDTERNEMFPTLYWTGYTNSSDIREACVFQTQEWAKYAAGQHYKQICGLQTTKIFFRSLDPSVRAAIPD